MNDDRAPADLTDADLIATYAGWIAKQQLADAGMPDSDADLDKCGLVIDALRDEMESRMRGQDARKMPDRELIVTYVASYLGLGAAMVGVAMECDQADADQWYGCIHRLRAEMARRAGVVS